MTDAEPPRAPAAAPDELHEQLEAMTPELVLMWLALHLDDTATIDKVHHLTLYFTEQCRCQ